MVREFIKNKKLSVTNYTAAKDVTVGMGVVIDYAAGTFSFPTKETADDIYVVHKERIPTGEATAIVDFSDYDEEFQNVAKGEKGKLMPYEPGDKFGVDQITATSNAIPAAGDLVAVGTDGLWKKATVASRYKFIKEYNDCGHKLYQIMVLDAAQTNA